MLEISLTLNSEVQIVKSKIIATAAILAALGFCIPIQHYLNLQLTVAQNPDSGNLKRRLTILATLPSDS